MILLAVWKTRLYKLKYEYLEHYGIDKTMEEEGRVLFCIILQYDTTLLVLRFVHARISRSNEIVRISLHDYRYIIFNKVRFC